MTCGQFASQNPAHRLRWVWPIQLHMSLWYRAFHCHATPSKQPFFEMCGQSISICQWNFQWNLARNTMAFAKRKKNTRSEKKWMDTVRQVKLKIVKRKPRGIGRRTRWERKKQLGVVQETIRSHGQQRGDERWKCWRLRIITDLRHALHLHEPFTTPIRNCTVLINTPSARHGLLSSNPWAICGDLSWC